MADAPFYMTIHIGDYLRKTPGLGPATWEHHGIYCSLRLLAWNTPGCRLPTDDLWIARHLGCTLEIFKEKVRPVLQMQFRQKRNWWVDDDLSTYHQKALKFSLSQSHRAKGMKNKEKYSSPGKPTLLPSKKQQQHRKIDSVVEKKKGTPRWIKNVRPGEQT